MNKNNNHRKQLRIPKSLVEPIRHALDSRDTQLSFAEALTVLGVSWDEFEQSDFSIDGDQYLALHRWLDKNHYAHIPMKDWLSFYSVTSGGVAGIAALSASTVRDAWFIVDRYLPLLHPGLKAVLQEGPKITRLHIELQADFEEMNRFLIEMVNAIFNAICEDAIGGRYQRTVHFMHDCGVDKQGESLQPFYEKLFLGYPVIFNSDFNGLSGDTSAMALKTIRANEATYQTARDILERQLQEMEAYAAFQSQVRKKLIELLDNNQHLSLEEFADMMHTSPRTLIRKLAQEETTYKQISNDVRLKRAKELLVGSNLSIKQIASRTGFTSSNSFSRAFKSLAGETPLQWRKMHSGK